MENDIFYIRRKSNMLLNEVYFWTSTIKDWKKLLEQDKYKDFIIEQLVWLKNKSKIKVYAFVIMPNHFHVIWEMLEKNGKEMPHASFNKWTSSQFLKNMRLYDPYSLSEFIEVSNERNHRFWQRDPLAVYLDDRSIVEQKLDYIHLNPLQEQWSLVKEPELYKYSSAEFYKSGKDDFGFLTHYLDRF